MYLLAYIQFLDKNIFSKDAYLYLNLTNSNTARNAKNTDPKFFFKRLKSIYGLPSFKLKNSVFCPC